MGIDAIAIAHHNWYYSITYNRLKSPPVEAAFCCLY
nr:MAG TPA_asm: hypothetical protein [Caudoviricetes sp.]